MRVCSKTPLFKKLGIKEGYIIYTMNSPFPYLDLFDQLPENLEIRKRIGKDIDFIHLFVFSKKELLDLYQSCYNSLKHSGILWISWPKGSSNISSDVNRETIREFVLDNGLVDVKVCSINNDWSALKFVYRLKDRL